MSGLPKITLGCDPELFVRDMRTGLFVTAYGMIKGDKKHPHEVPGGALQVDGCALEFNIVPVSTRDDWNAKITQVSDHLRRELPPHHEVVLQPTVTFDPAYWATVPEAAKTLGCDPDYNAYTKNINPKPSADGPMRSAAGHIHIGWRGPDDLREVTDTDHIADCFEVVKQLDFYVGVPSLLWDKDPERRKLYGKAGACRIKPYGVEYRTPSNMWLARPETQNFVFDATLAAMKDLFEGKAIREDLGENWAQNLIDHPENFSNFNIRTLTNNSYRLAYEGGLSNLATTLKQPKTTIGIGEFKPFRPFIHGDAEPWGRIDPGAIIRPENLQAAAQRLAGRAPDFAIIDDPIADHVDLNPLRALDNAERQRRGG